jgi:hypothetical protein
MGANEKPSPIVLKCSIVSAEHPEYPHQNGSIAYAVRDPDGVVVFSGTVGQLRDVKWHVGFYGPVEHSVFDALYPHGWVVECDF